MAKLLAFGIKKELILFVLRSFFCNFASKFNYSSNNKFKNNGKKCIAESKSCLSA